MITCPPDPSYPPSSPCMYTVMPSPAVRQAPLYVHMHMPPHLHAGKSKKIPMHVHMNPYFYQYWGTIAALTQSITQARPGDLVAKYAGGGGRGVGRRDLLAK